MKKVIRHSVFETNSSSTHTLTICSDDEYERFKNGELYLNQSWSKCFEYLPKFCTKEQILEEKAKYDKENHVKVLMEGEAKALTEQFRSFEAYQEEQNSSAEGVFLETHTTKSGDEVVVFGWYGHA
jgi:hypothetical protein